MKISTMTVLMVLTIAAVGIAFLGVVSVKKNIDNYNDEVYEIVRRRVDDQIAAFQKVDLAIRERSPESKIVARIGLDTEEWKYEDRLSA